jgi:transcriptional regulator with XRE-family HTH domain
MCRRLRAAREAAGLTQVEAAEALGHFQNFVSKCETGERRLDPVELAEFAELYGTTLAALVPPERSALTLAKGARSRKVAERTLEPKKRTGRRAGKGSAADRAGSS